MSTNGTKTEKKFPNKLRAARDLRGMTQQQVADAIGVTITAYQNYEYEKRDVRASALAKLSRALNCSVDYLLGIDPEPQRLAAAPVEHRMAPIAMRDTLFDSSGSPIGCVQTQEVANTLFHSHPKAWWFLVESASMSRIIPDHALILVDPDAQVRSGHIALVVVGDGEPVVRRVFFDKHTVILRTESHDREFCDTQTDIRDIRILGRVVAFSSEENRL